MTYQYDAAGRVTRIEWPDAVYVAYDHDLYGAITAVRLNGATSGAGILATWGWTNLGQPASVARADGAGAGTAYGYDAFGRMTSLAHDASGGSNDLTLGFGYNPAGQIVGRTVSNDAYVWTPSMAGTNYTNNGLNQVTAVGGSSVGYDANENVDAIGGATYGYDAANRLTSASAGLGATAYTFDPAGRLATSAVGGSTTRFQYSGVQLVAEYDGSGALVSRYVPGLGIDNVVTAYAGPGTGSPSWLLADERGSVAALTGPSGAVTNINRYDEYGVPASGNVGRFQYTGQAWLAEAGAYHYRARTYLQGVGRFGQSDPIGYAAGAKLYAYVGGDPVNRIDPLGMLDNCITVYRRTRTYDADGELVRVSINVERDICLGPRVPGFGVSWGDQIDSIPTSVCSIGTVKVLVRGTLGTNITFSGNIAFPNGQPEIIDLINDAWTGQFGDIRLSTEMALGTGGLTAYIANGPGGTPSADVGGPNLYLNTLVGGTPLQAAYARWTPGHEFGHSLYLKDQYDPATGAPFAGFQSNIMGAMGGRVDEVNVRAALNNCR